MKKREKERKRKRDRERDDRVNNYSNLYWRIGNKCFGKKICNCLLHYIYIVYIKYVEQFDQPSVEYLIIFCIFHLRLTLLLAWLRPLFNISINIQFNRDS